MSSITIFVNLETIIAVGIVVVSIPILAICWWLDERNRRNKK